MQTETEDLLNSAITKIRLKILPQSIEQSSTHSQPDPYKGIFDVLEVYDKSRLDPDIDMKTKFIYDFLEDGKEPVSNKIMAILNELPVLSNELTIERVYKYCRLKDEYFKTTKRAEMLDKRIKNI